MGLLGFLLNSSTRSILLLADTLPSIDAKLMPPSVRWYSTTDKNFVHWLMITHLSVGSFFLCKGAKFNRFFSATTELYCKTTNLTHVLLQPLLLSIVLFIAHINFF